MNSEQANRGRGCFFYGCLAAVVMVIVGLIGGYLGVRYFVNKLVNTYTDTAPLAIPTVETTQAEADALLERVRVFKNALAGGTAQPLAIGTRELNTLIAFSPDFKDLKGKAYVDIEGDRLRGQISLPLDQLPFLGAKGRYLNGEASLKASLENGILVVTLDSLKVKGKDAPAEVLAALRKENLAKDIYRNPDTAKILGLLETIEIKDDKLTIRPRATAVEKPAEAPGASGF
jgi:hypothetical protein